VRGLLLIALIVGCAPPREAPAELGAIGVFLFADFERTPSEVEVAAATLAGILEAEVDWEGERRDRRFDSPILTLEDLHDVEHPDADPELQSPVAQTRASAFSVADHARLQLEADHAPWEPSSPNQYDRTFPEDPTCWADGTCDELKTDNRILKENVLYTVLYDTRKHLRRFELPDGRAAMVSRTWSEEQGQGEAGRATIDQNYASEAWLEGPDGGTRRIQFAWSSVTLAGVDLETIDIRGVIGNGIDDTMRAQDEWLEAN